MKVEDSEGYEQWVSVPALALGRRRPEVARPFVRKVERLARASGCATTSDAVPNPSAKPAVHFSRTFAEAKAMAARQAAALAAADHSCDGKLEEHGDGAEQSDAMASLGGGSIRRGYRTAAAAGAEAENKAKEASLAGAAAAALAGIMEVDPYSPPPNIFGSSTGPSSSSRTAVATGSMRQAECPQQ